MRALATILRTTEQNHKKFLNHTTLRTTTKNQNYHIICLKSHKPDQDQGQQQHKTKSRFIMLCGLLLILPAARSTTLLQIVPCHALQNNFISQKPFLQVIWYWLSQYKNLRKQRVKQFHSNFHCKLQAGLLTRGPANSRFIFIQQPTTQGYLIVLKNTKAC